MPFKDKQYAQEYKNAWRREQRLKRGLQKRGRKVHTEEQRVQAKKNRDAYMKQYNIENPYSSFDPKHRLWRAAKRRSKQENVPFDITIDDIIIPTHCPYLGIELISSVPRGQQRSAVISLDKTIPSLGYTKGNIEVMSMQANTMKSDATPEQLITFAKAILKRYE